MTTSDKRIQPLPCEAAVIRMATGMPIAGAPGMNVVTVPLYWIKRSETTHAGISLLGISSLGESLPTSQISMHPWMYHF